MTRPTTLINGTAPRRPLAFRPRTEGLEDRKLMTAGTLDPTFGSGGVVVIPSNSTAYADSVQILSDGTSLAAGTANGSFNLSRFNPDGSLYNAFGSGGRVSTAILNSSYANDMALQSKGAIVLAGAAFHKSSTDGDFALARYLPNGSLDTSFGPSHNGTVTTPISTVISSTSPGASKNDTAWAVAIQPNDQKIVVGGQTYAETYTTATGTYADYNSALVRYNTDGSLDLSFGKGGILVTAIGAGDDMVKDVAVQSDGKIITVGYASDSSARRMMYIARYNADGSPDLAFGSNGTGRVLTAIGSTSNAVAQSVAVLSTGSLLVSGNAYGANTYTNADLVLARYTPAGSLDSTFGGGTGVVVADLGGNEHANGIAVQGDGKIVVGGRFSSLSTPRDYDCLVARFLSDGTTDAGFGNGGFTVNSTSSAIDYINGVALQADGKIVAVGDSQAITSTSPGTVDNILIARYLGDPTLLCASAVAPAPVRQSLTAAQARPALAEALAYWRSHGEETSRLGHLDLAIADLGGARLGEASGSTITLDDNAAGWGWSASRGHKGPAGRMDLLTALTHEVGHLLGHDHAEGGVMTESLAPGVRRALPAAPPHVQAATSARLGARSTHTPVGHHRAITRR